MIVKLNKHEGHQKKRNVAEKTRGRFGLARTLIWTPPTPYPPSPSPPANTETRTQTQTDKQVQSSRQAHRHTDKINAYANNWETWLLWLRTKMKKKMKNEI